MYTWSIYAINYTSGSMYFFHGVLMLFVILFCSFSHYRGDVYFTTLILSSHMWLVVANGMYV